MQEPLELEVRPFTKTWEMQIRHVSSSRLQALCLLRAGPGCQIFHSISLWHVLHIPELKITAACEWGAAQGGSRSHGAGWLSSLPSLGRTSPGHANSSPLSSPLPPHIFPRSPGADSLGTARMENPQRGHLFPPLGGV